MIISFMLYEVSKNLVLLRDLPRPVKFVTHLPTDWVCDRRLYLERVLQLAQEQQPPPTGFAIFLHLFLPPNSESANLAVGGTVRALAVTVI